MRYAGGLRAGQFPFSDRHDDITRLPLPPRSRELNPVENIWQFMRDNWLSNRVFKYYDDILGH